MDSRRGIERCRIPAAVLAAILSFQSVPAFAQSTRTQAQATAEMLFEQARDAMNKGDYDKACPAFAESQRLDPAGGTILNLGLCYEAQGKRASAWAAFKESIAYAIRDRRDNREKLAREHVAKLEPLLNRVSVKPAADAAVAGLTISIDGVPLGEAVWGSPTPVDPGTHVVTASAPGYYEWKWNIEVAQDVEVLEVELPALSAKPEPPPLPPNGNGPGRDTPPAPKPTIMYVAYGVGAAGVAVGAVTAILAISKRTESTRFCDTDSTCVPGSNGVSLNNQAITLSWISTAAFAVGVAGAGVGTYFLLKSPSKPKTTGSTAFAPYFGPKEAGIGFTRTW